MCHLHVNIALNDVNMLPQAQVQMWIFFVGDKVAKTIYPKTD